MGALPKEEDASEPELSPAVDVSAEGTLVWLRRPNGSWWPSIVISPQDVPVGCAAPPRCAATPIMLLGRRRDGPTFVYALPPLSSPCFPPPSWSISVSVLTLPLPVKLTRG